MALLLVVGAAMLAPAAATAGNGNGGSSGKSQATQPAYLPGSLLADAAANPGKKFDVIVELKKGGDQSDLTSKVKGLGVLRHRFASIDGVAARLPGAAIVSLAKRTDLLAITRDAKVGLSDFQPAQVWPAAVHADQFWPKAAVTCDTDPLTGLQLDPSCAPSPGVVPPTPPAIAIVDSGIDTTRTADFGNRVIDSEALSSLSPGATNDGAGHGTFVASIAAGESSTHPGVATTAPIVNLRVMDDNGQAMTSDVISAADWILANHERLDIKVANFSLHSASGNSFKFDPLDHAVERLWFAGVTVVAASGNYGVENTPQQMVFAPGNDPFVITVGATQTSDTADTADDTVAPWSAYGYTADGFSKPDLVAPGRYMIAAMPDTSTDALARPDHMVEPGYYMASGTSFSAPVVAGAAAQLLAQHPDWTPDQVKGALMDSAHPLPLVTDHQSYGMGEIDMAAANTIADPPNPNAGLDKFVVADPTVAGGKSFDAISWTDAASADISWNSISWTDISWSDISWNSISWYDTISWSDISWASISWTDESQADSSLSDISWTDNSLND